MSDLGEHGNSRRAFFRNSGMALLAGYAFTNRTGLAQAVQQPNSDKYQSVTVNTHDYTGEIQERLDFPKDWQVDVVRLAGEDNPTLSADQIIQRLRSPIGSKQLRDIAAGKKTAAITFDDISRPTPVHLVAKHVVNELNAAGIDDDHILFICAQGSHQAMSPGQSTKQTSWSYLTIPGSCLEHFLHLPIPNSLLLFHGKTPGNDPNR